MIRVDPGPGHTAYPLARVMEILVAKARPAHREGMARYGINPHRRLGVSIPELRRLGREFGRNHSLALELWATGIPDARILASLVAPPASFQLDLAEAWAADFDSWDVCDQVCMNLFRRCGFVWDLLPQWALRDEEFVRRAAFATLASLAVHARQETDEPFLAALPWIREAAGDRRNYVRKAVEWALRSIARRSPGLGIAVAELNEQLRREGIRLSRK